MIGEEKSMAQYIADEIGQDFVIDQQEVLDDPIENSDMGAIWEAIGEAASLHWPESGEVFKDGDASRISQELADKLGVVNPQEKVLAYGTSFKFWIKPDGTLDDFNDNNEHAQRLGKAVYTDEEEADALEEAAQEGWTRGTFTEHTLYMDLGDGKTAGWALSKLTQDGLGDVKYLAIEGEIVDVPPGMDVLKAWNQKGRPLPPPTQPIHEDIRNRDQENWKAPKVTGSKVLAYGDTHHGDASRISQELADKLGVANPQVKAGLGDILPLENGFKLVSSEWFEYGDHYGPPREYWELRQGDSPKPIGKFLVANDGNEHVMSSSWVSEKNRGNGLGTLAYKALAGHYGSLESDTTKTSRSAKKVWEKLGAVPSGKTNRGTQNKDRMIYKPEVTDGVHILAYGDTHQWGCIMADLPADIADKIKAWTKSNVPETSLYTAEEGYGYEEQSHCTAAYGLDPKTDRGEIEALIKRLGPPEIKLGKISKFRPADKPYEVLKIEVGGKDMPALNKAIAEELGTPGNDHPKYEGHVSLAYVLPGECEDLIGKEPLPGVFTLTDFSYTAPESEGGKDKKSVWKLDDKNVRAKQTAYHGTPHKFDKFSTDKVGTGEGGQSRGWGIYVTNQKELAERYQDNVSSKKGADPTSKSFQGKTIMEWYGYFENLAAKTKDNAEARKYYDRMSMLENLEITWDANKTMAQAKEDGTPDPDAVKWFTDVILPEFERPGATHTVDIPEDSELLDSDAPLRNQPQKVLSIIKKTPQYAKAEAWAKAEGHQHADDLTGGEFYGALNQYEKMSPEQSSKYLLSLGIPGLKYADKNDQVEPVTNYVIWDESAIGITGARILASKRTIIWDFDGTISEDVGFPAFGPPRPDIIELMRLAQSAGIENVIQSCRWSVHELSTPESAAFQMCEAIAWLGANDVPYDRLVAEKPLAEMYVDDHGFNVTDLAAIRHGIEECASGFPVDGSLKVCADLKFWMSPVGKLNIFTSTREHCGELPDEYDQRNEAAIDDGWVRGWINGSELIIDAPDDAAVKRALEKLPSEYTFPQTISVLIVPTGKDTSVPVNEGEDALDAWNHRNDIRHRVNASDFDEMRKRAIEIVDADPSWKQLLTDPAGAQSFGQLQLGLKNARTEQELRQTWEDFQDLPFSIVQASRRA